MSGSNVTEEMQVYSIDEEDSNDKYIDFSTDEEDSLPSDML